jgi:hypothetical protein
MKIRPVGAELFHADGRAHRRTDGQTDGRRDRQTDMKIIVDFLNFAKAPKNNEVPLGIRPPDPSV